MPLPFFKRSTKEAVTATEAGAPLAGDEDLAVQAARTRARRRLIGAVVLLAAGIVGFPILFETQPRPLPADLPIQVSTPGAVVAAAPPAARAASKPLPPLPTPPADAGNEPAAAPGSAASTPSPVDPPAAPVIAAKPATEEPLVAPVKAEAAKPPPAPASKPASGTVTARAGTTESPRVTAVADKPKPAASAAVAARPASAAEPRPTADAASAPKAARYVVQVGAFTDPAALRDARQRVEKLGFKSYTQVVETPAGARTRVRVGPFDTREEAERASVRLKGGGLPANLLTL